MWGQLRVLCLLQQAQTERRRQGRNKRGREAKSPHTRCPEDPTRKEVVITIIKTSGKGERTLSEVIMDHCVLG